MSLVRLPRLCAREAGLVFLGILAMACAVVILFPETSMGRYLRSLLVEQPQAWVSKLNIARLTVHGSLIGLLAVVLFLARGSELVVLVAQAVPEIVAWLVAVDAITFLEISLAIWLVTSNARVRAAASAARSAAWRWSVRHVPWFAARLRMARARMRRTPANKPAVVATDDDERPAGTFVFA